MTNLHGSFLWYELLTSDPDAAGKFYGDVIGWESRSANQEGMDYRLFSASGSDIGGYMALPPEAADCGAKPGWLGYIAVDDVDASVERITAAGGKVQMPAMDIEGVGRMAMVADPQGVPFYVMRGLSDETSDAFDPQQMGHCAWNELSTSDQVGALAFYGEQFGWTKGDVLPMGDAGDYQFIHLGEEMIGAVMTNPPEAPPPAWTFAFNIPDIDEGVAKVTNGGGTIVYGPVEVPGDAMVVVAVDPQGAKFSLVAPKS